jgi:hypothetical protein
MNEIKSFTDLEVYKNILPLKNKREINSYLLKDVTLRGTSLYYPNCLLYSNSTTYNPIKETTMSLSKIGNNLTIDIEQSSIKNVEKEPVFFFIYNTDNYYHFIYDTLPYLITYFELKKTIPNLKLLMSYPNYQKDEFYKFVIEFLSLLNIDKEDIIISNKETQYENIYISTSYTHDGKSNEPPRKEIYKFYQNISDNINKKYKKTFPKKIYISRRTWINNDTSNIGTNYTTKRKLINEDLLVEKLSELGFIEIFTENLSTIDKILLFSNADTIIGPIGGGLCNVLFSNKNTKLISLLSPTFLDINYRFKYSFENVKVNYFDNTTHVESGPWKRYMRIYCLWLNIIGEIEEIKEETLIINYTKENVSGWNNELKLSKLEVRKNLCERLDKGLNSPWEVNIEKLIKEIT